MIKLEISINPLPFSVCANNCNLFIDKCFYKAETPPRVNFLNLKKLFQAMFCSISIDNEKKTFETIGHQGKKLEFSDNLT